MHLDTIQHQLQISETSAIPMWLKRARPDILEWLFAETNHFSVKNVMERIYILLHGKPPICKDGNYKKFNTFEKGYRACCYLGNKCTDVAEARMEKQKETLIRKYGVENVMNIPDVKEKIKHTNILKYGTEHHSQNELIKKKTKNTRTQKTEESKLAQREKTAQTTLKKYGVKHHMMLKSQQDKVKESTFISIGKQHALQADQCLKKMKETRQLRHQQDNINKKTKQTLLIKYGVDAPSKINLSEKASTVLYNQEIFCDFVKNKTRKEVIEELGIAFHTLYLYAKKYQASDLFAKPLLSEPEHEIAEWLTTLSVPYIIRDRSILNPKELDFYLPDHRIAIEFCGLYWHSEISAGKTKEYHAAKYESCLAQNIRLITIFEDEWKFKKNQVMSILKNMLIDSDRLYARKCEVKEISSHSAKIFVDKIHIQEYCTSTINLALFYDDQIVSVMTFGKSRFSKKHEYEMIRYCSSRKTVGGAKKLFNFFLKKYNPQSVISYSDNRYFNGTVYSTLGFTKKKTTVGYFYTNYRTRYDRQRFQKHKLVKSGADSNLTEFQIMTERGYDRIWDCGQTAWEYIKQKQ